MSESPAEELHWVQGQVRDPARWWERTPWNNKTEKEVRALFMSKDRGKRGVRKKRFQ